MKNHIYVFSRDNFKKQIEQLSDDKSVRQVIEWFIISESQFLFLEPAIISLCDIYNARAYINLNPKSPEEILYKILQDGIEKVKNKEFKPLNLLSSAVGKCNGNERKIWIVDIDNKEYDLELICARIQQCQSGFTKNIIDILPTINGFHILTCPFNLQEFNREGFEEITIHKNNPTLLYATN